jgi:two-component system NtrC family response regulator
MTPGRVLIVDDDPDTRSQLDWSLRDEYEVLLAADAEEARRLIREKPADLVLLDLHLPPDTAVITTGMELLDWIHEEKPDVPVIVMTGDRERQTAVRCVERGAFDFFEKPVAPDELRVLLRRALRLRHLEREVASLREGRPAGGALAAIAGTSPAMERVRELIRRVADTKATVLIRGESGTGKSLVAQALHGESGRRGGAFVALSCSALPQTLVEEELFGHERGAFTGAFRRRIGKFEHADGGTLFLDEVGDLVPETQVRLLRVLQESEFERLGGNETVRVDVRVVAATHRDLEAKIREGTFRQDLFYRLKVVELELPALRERRSDIPLLTGLFLRRHGQGKVHGCTRAATQILCEADWPGNVRELEHAVERACILSEGKMITPADLPPELRPEAGARGELQVEIPEGGLSLASLEKDLVRKALEKTNWNQTRAAGLLGLSRAQLLQRMKRFSLRQPSEGS